MTIHLTARELVVLDGYARGLTDKQIQEGSRLSLSSVGNYGQRLRDKFAEYIDPAGNVRVQLALLAMLAGVGKRPGQIPEIVEIK